MEEMKMKEEDPKGRERAGGQRGKTVQL